MELKDFNLLFTTLDGNQYPGIVRAVSRHDALAKAINSPARVGFPYYVTLIRGVEVLV